MITALIAAIAAITGAVLARTVDIAGYLQTNAKAHSDVESLKRELDRMEVRVAKMEEQMERLGKDNSHLTEQNSALTAQNMLLIEQNGRLIDKNGQLIVMLQGGDDEETTEDTE